MTAINSCGAEEYCEWVYVGSIGVPEEEGEKGDLMIYPNPAMDQLAVRSSQFAAKLMIYDMYGRMVKKLRNIGSYPYYIDISNLSPGMYLLSIETKEGKVISGKFVKGE
jgi:hypothetical protein